MNRTFLNWLLAASLALNIGIVGTAVFKRFDTEPVGGVQSAAVNLPEYLAMNDGQRGRWQEIEREFLADLSDNWRQIRTHREALVRLVFSDAPDRAAIDAEQAKIAALQDTQQRRVIAQLLAERELLDEGQRKKLMTLLLNRYQQEAGEEEKLHR